MVSEAGLTGEARPPQQEASGFREVVLGRLRAGAAGVVHCWGGERCLPGPAHILSWGEVAGK